MPENGVEETILILSVIVVLLHNQFSGIQTVNPSGNFLVILAFAGDGVDQHSAIDISAAE